MKILDLRPAWARLFAGRPAARENLLTRGWGSLVGSVINRRVKRRPEPPVTPFLVSVGNLALGGTGKTPVVMDLARRFGALGVRGAILTRGYGSPLEGPVAIAADTPQAGDEARLMAGAVSHLGWPVIQSHRRSRGLEYLLEKHPGTQLAILEDAHQSAGLARHLDLLILDGWETIGPAEKNVLVPRTGPVFPLGPWRENAAGSERAAALLVESAGAVPGTSIHHQPVFAFHRKTTLRWQTPPAGDAESSHCWGLVSGIARPAGFEKAAGAQLPGEVALSIRCRDHAPYAEPLVSRILADLDAVGATALATTAKDWVKLAPLWKDPRPVAILDLDLVWGQQNALGRWLAERAGLPFSGSDQSGSTAP